MRMKKLSLLEGRIVPLLIKLTLPIIGTSFLEMAYALIDMLWIGKLGASSIAAVGVAGMFSWLSQGLAMIATQGGQVKTGHSLGAGNQEAATDYASSVDSVRDYIRTIILFLYSCILKFLYWFIWLIITSHY